MIFFFRNGGEKYEDKCYSDEMKFADPAYNFTHAEELIRHAALEKPDVYSCRRLGTPDFFLRRI